MLNLSILITCFNKEQYLDECVSSIKRQTQQPKEIIIVHDGCEQPMAHAEADTIILHDNRGVAKARHEAFRFSTGELILFVDGDDILSPDYIEKMIGVLKKGYDVAYPDLYLFAGAETRLVVTPKRITPAFVQSLKRVVMPVTSMMNRNLYEKLEGFKPWPVLEDLDFWIRAMCNGYTFGKAETLLWYRRVPNTRNDVDLAKRKRILEEILAQFTFEGNKISWRK